MVQAAADSSILTRGLRRTLGIILLGAIVLGGVQATAVNKVQDEIAHWHFMSEINVLRRALLEQTEGVETGLPPQQSEQVFAAFDALYGKVDSSIDHNSHDRHAGHFAMLIAEARTAFERVQESDQRLGPLRQEVENQVDGLHAQSADWSQRLLQEERRVVLAGEELDHRLEENILLNDALGLALFAASSLEQQVTAIQRLFGVSDRQVIRSSIASLSSEGLPPPCIADQVERDGVLCQPSPNRVHVSIRNLVASEESMLAGNVITALQGLKGYVRAGQARMDELSSASTALVTQMRQLREDLTSLRQLTNSLNRVNRAILDMQALIQSTIVTKAALADNDLQVTAFIGQIRLRMLGLLRNSLLFEDGATPIATRIDDLQQSWASLRDETEFRLSALAIFKEKMNQLSTQVETRTLDAKQLATFWVNIYTTGLVLLGAALALSLLSLAIMAQRRFFVPLVDVTGSILNLARGRLDMPVHLSERAFGFDRLGNALEQLRQEMIERQRLALRDQEQQKIIADNMTELEKASSELEWMAMHDPLTGLPNRRKADMDMTAVSDRNSETDFCIMQLDLDRFKAINDTLGHAAGDLVLKFVAEILSDVLPHSATCYRLGGDEFAVLHPGTQTTDQMSALAISLTKRLESPIDYKGHRLSVGASIGIAFGRDADFDASKCITNADLALYKAKKHDRQSFHFFDQDLAQAANRTQQIADRLKVALEQKGFDPYYQPQFDAKTRELHGLEVLCRWHDAELGQVPPPEFLTVAEELQIVEKIDEILLEKVSDQLAWAKEFGFSVPKVSFNITADRLLTAGLADRLLSLIDPETTVAIELLESISLDQPAEEFATAIDDLRSKGISIEIDDFGSDRASLAGLMAVRPDVMKIDRSIVMPIIGSASHLDLVRKIIDIGKALDVTVIAEGVESLQHADILSEIGCDVLQGFGLAKPMPLQEVSNLVKAKSFIQDSQSTAVA